MFEAEHYLLIALETEKVSQGFDKILGRS